MLFTMSMLATHRPAVLRLAAMLLLTSCAAWMPAFAPAASADVFKCQNDNGAAVYQDTPCSAGRELRNFQDDPPTLSVVPFQSGGTAPAASSSGSSSTSPATSTRKSSTRASGSSRSGGKSAKAEAGNAGERKYLHVGMTDAEVIARIGPPDMRSSATGSHHGARWSYLPHANDPQTITTLTMVNGKVSNIERSMVR
jgi:hypothetical protein